MWSSCPRTGPPASLRVCRKSSSLTEPSDSRSFRKKADPAHNNKGTTAHLSFKDTIAISGSQKRLFLWSVVLASVSSIHYTYPGYFSTVQSVVAILKISAVSFLDADDDEKNFFLVFSLFFLFF